MRILSLQPPKPKEDMTVVGNFGNIRITTIASEKKKTHHLCSLPDPSCNRASRRSPLSLYFTVIFPPDECSKIEDLFCLYSMVIVSLPLWILFRCFMTESNMNTVEMLESAKWSSETSCKKWHFSVTFLTRSLYHNLSLKNKRTVHE